MKKKYLLIPPELVDGEHSTVIARSETREVGTWLSNWLKENAEHGNELTIGVVELTDLRRGHYRTLSAPIYKVPGQRVWVRATHVQGNTVEWREGDRFYKVI